MQAQGEWVDCLFFRQDKTYREFQANLIPTVPKERFIGVRTPVLRAYAKDMAKTPLADAFLSALPHDYFEENQLHAFLLAREKDFSACLTQVEIFLPFIDNWATCDQLCLPVFRTHKKELIAPAARWMESKKTYTVRFGIKQMMDYFLDEDFDLAYAKKVAGIRSDAYYVNMMIAWYFATALAKQYEAIFPLMEDPILPMWVHNKTIQKAVESKRIPEKKKEELKALRQTAER